MSNCLRELNRKDPRTRAKAVKPAFSRAISARRNPLLRRQQVWQRLFLDRAFLNVSRIPRSRDRFQYPAVPAFACHSLHPFDLAHSFTISGRAVSVLLRIAAVSRRRPLRLPLLTCVTGSKPLPPARRRCPSRELRNAPRSFVVVQVHPRSGEIIKIATPPKQTAALLNA